MFVLLQQAYADDARLTGLRKVDCPLWTINDLVDPQPRNELNRSSC